MSHTTRPRPLTPPQLHALRSLADGWQCQIGGVDRPHVRPLSWYSFWRQGTRRSVSGSTLVSLQARGLTTWDGATLTLAWDGSRVPGYTLVLTDAGQQAAQS
jgi:hypothetical protein